MAIAVPLSASRTPTLSRFEFTEPHMGTTFRVVVYAPGEPAAADASRRAFTRIAALDAILTDYSPSSELSRLTREPIGRAVPVSLDLYTIIERAQALAAASDDAFDITVGPLTRLWRRARRQVELPSPEDLDAARKVTGYTLLSLDPGGRTVTVAREGMQLDAGGIAKGYAADAALAVIRQSGLDSALVAAGGDLALGDPPPGRQGWQIDLAGLDETHPAPGSPRLLSRCGISTSGDAEQWVEIGGVRYSHILDPRTGVGLTGHTSATVVAADATTSDMLATVVEVLGPERGVALVDRWTAAAALVGVRDAHGDTWTHSARWRRQGRPN